MQPQIPLALHVVRQAQLLRPAGDTFGDAKRGLLRGNRARGRTRCGPGLASRKAGQIRERRWAPCSVRSCGGFLPCHNHSPAIRHAGNATRAVQIIASIMRLPFSAGVLARVG